MLSGTPSVRLCDVPLDLVPARSTTDARRRPPPPQAILYARAVVGLTGPPHTTAPLLRELDEALLRELPELSARELALAAWSVGQLGHRPEPEW